MIDAQRKRRARKLDRDRKTARKQPKKGVWEEVRAGERKTLHWICGGAKLPSGAT